MATVSYEEFKKMDIRVGTIRSVEPVEGTDKLLKCMIDFGLQPAVAGSPDHLASQDSLREAKANTEAGAETGVSAPEPTLRQIVSGIREFFPEYEKLVGKQVLYIVNLEPRMIRGVESQGMLMAVDGPDGAPVFLTPERPVNPGSAVR